MQNKSEHSLGKPGQKSPRAKYDLQVALDDTAKGRLNDKENKRLH